MRWAPVPATEPVVDLVLPPVQLSGAVSEENAYARGYEAGLLDAQDAAAREIASMREDLRRSLADLSQVRSDLLRRTEREVVNMALAIARKVLDREARIEPAVILALAKAAADRLSGEGRVEVEVSQADFAALGDSSSPSLEIVPAAHLRPGQCLVTSATGFIDVSLQAQIDEIAAQLLGDDDVA